MSDSLEGKKLPVVTLAATEIGQLRIPEDLMGKWTTIYFYPKDDTPGCTKQACAYRDHVGDFKKLGVQVLGVSGDDLESHEAFKAKFNLNFPLIADTAHVLGDALGTWQGTSNSRDSFLIGPDGNIRKVWRKVSAANTMQETYEEAQRLIQTEADRKIG